MENLGRIQSPSSAAGIGRVPPPARDGRRRGRAFLEELHARHGAESEPEPEPEAAAPPAPPHRSEETGPDADSEVGGHLDVLA